MTLLAYAAAVWLLATSTALFNSWTAAAFNLFCLSLVAWQSYQYGRSNVPSD